MAIIVADVAPAGPSVASERVLAIMATPHNEVQE